MEFIKSLERELNLTETENGAGALASTLNPVLDAFGTLGAMRTSPDDRIIEVFSRAFASDRELAMRLLFYIRDVRGGQGERKTFRVLTKWLAENYPDAIANNIDNVPYYGRYDDLFTLLGTGVEGKVIEYIREQLSKDLEACIGDGDISLLGKWMPSENASSSETKALARRMAKALSCTPKQYRKCLSTLRAKIDVVERKMSANNFGEIEYPSVPSKAHMNYANAFYKHDEERYKNYLVDITQGNAKINAGALFPVDIVHRILNGACRSDVDNVVTNAQWESLPNYLEGIDERSICVVDVSGSMEGIPMEVAISLGLYNADKANGPFKGKFITFSENPKIQSVVGNTISEKVFNLKRSDWGSNTNIELVFDAILDAAIAGNCTQQDMPSKVYIISDMQFDQARSAIPYPWSRNKPAKTVLMDDIKARYKDAGYRLPNIVYWNVRESECGMFQDTYEGIDCCMVSGYSPSLFEAVAKGTEYVVEENGNVRETLDPMNVMIKTLMDERYDRVK